MKKYNLIYYPEITSTNTFAVRNIYDFADRDVLMAEVQSEGRGRFDRKWISDKPDNIYISFVLKPSINAPLNNIPQYLSLKLCEVLESYGINPVIKWPNDVLINHKKISGILAQTSFRGNSFQGLILGIGVNLNFEQSDMDKIDRPATSLNLVLNKKINRDEFLNKLLNNFFQDYDEFLEKGFDFIKEAYIKNAYFLGSSITVNTYKEEVKGIAKCISDDGSLVILSEGKDIMVNVGEILEF
jgi:BirA family biotin operon repressor/biotin-[acetyl-CoA-carboxylase] ligase